MIYIFIEVEYYIQNIFVKSLCSYIYILIFLLNINNIKNCHSYIKIVKLFPLNKKKSSKISSVPLLPSVHHPLPSPRLPANYNGWVRNGRIGLLISIRKTKLTEKKGA
jgi:hypothetical protein